MTKVFRMDGCVARERKQNAASADAERSRAHERKTAKRAGEWERKELPRHARRIAARVRDLQEACSAAYEASQLAGQQGALDDICLAVTPAILAAVHPSPALAAWLANPFHIKPFFP